MEEVIQQALQYLEEGKFEEYERVILENLHVFPKEAQVEILGSIIEAKLTERIESLKEINSILEGILEDLRSLSS